jgi:hypothetical protein
MFTFVRSLDETSLRRDRSDEGWIELIGIVVNGCLVDWSISSINSPFGEWCFKNWT